MNSGKLVYIGQINLENLRNYIIDNTLSEYDTIILHPIDFDNIVIEYREFYKESLKLPFFIFDTLIEGDDIQKKTPLNRINLILEDDSDRITKNQISTNQKIPIYDTIYRCGWCGNVVDYDGREFDSETKFDKIAILKNQNNIISVQKVHGNCCPNKN